MTLDECTIGARVKVSGGIPGTVQMVSKLRRRCPVLVQLDTGQAWAFAPDELTKVEVPKILGVPVP